MEHLTQWIGQFAGLRIVVIGDVILDEYLIGRAARLSREAPIPVLEYEQRQQIAGGAANPAANIAALGGYALQIGVIGADAEGEALRAVLDERGIITDRLVVDKTRPTTLKTRVMAHMGLRYPQQVARLDRLSRARIAPEVEADVCQRITDAARNADALLLSDYHCGMLTPGVIACATAAGRLITADAQGELDKYRGIGVVKCNADEARAYLGRELQTADDFAAAAADLCRDLALTRGMVITRGADGATLAETNAAPIHCPAPVITDVYDTVGAGDTAIAVITLAVSAGASLGDAVTLANYASGLVVRRVGNYAPTPDELGAALAASR